VDDFLIGVCNLFPELARLATNSVTMGDFDRPLKIAAFLGDVYNGFRLLNLKNDALRKRFDGIKYDVKRAEGVVYDISIRGLTKKE
jgi:predicted translin family RNA/ssDNA-binding protein